MKVRMIQTMVGYPDGFTRTVYDKDQIYELPDSLANNFLSLKVVELIDNEKDLGSAPDNKAFTKPSDNKSEEVEKEQDDKPTRKVRKKKGH